ncbi:MAG: hypothetical protein AAGG59_15305 [Bacteroidota bacterium]
MFATKALSLWRQETKLNGLNFRLFYLNRSRYGVGILIGFWIVGQITDVYVVGEGRNWKWTWQIPAAFAAIVLIIFSPFLKK